MQKLYRYDKIDTCVANLYNINYRSQHGDYGFCKEHSPPSNLYHFQRQQFEQTLVNWFARRGVVFRCQILWYKNDRPTGESLSTIQYSHQVGQCVGQILKEMCTDF